MNNIYINIKDVAEAKGLKSTRSLRLELNKSESKYISREVQVNGGTSYEILFSSLEPELQDKLRKNENKSTAVGGDGTVNKVAQMVAFTDKTLAIIPTGTANLLAAKLGIPTNLRKNLKILSKENINKIDALKINDELC